MISYGLYLFVVFNVMLAVFNLIPIPPLDGSTLLFRFLPPRTAWQIRPSWRSTGCSSCSRWSSSAGILSDFIFVSRHSWWVSRRASSGRTCGPA